jgi:hypothetical protein
MAGPPDLTRARANVEARMLTDTCQIHERTLDDDTFDEEQGTYALAVGDLVYDGPCALIPSAQERVVTSTDGAVYDGPKRAYDLYLPADTVGPKPDHIVTMTSSLRDPAIPGREFSVVDDIINSFDVVRRLRLAEVRTGDLRSRGTEQ